MNSAIKQDTTQQKQEISVMSRYQAVEFTLTVDQYTIIQHFLPKRFSLQQRKSTKRQKASSHKLIDAEMSRFSGGFENNDEEQGRSKRARTKKIDRYLQQQMPRPAKRVSHQKVSIDQQMSQCAKLLALLKKNPNATPFLDPVDPKKSGASNYFDIITEPMDFYTIQRNLKLGNYSNASQFHADVEKIWQNSYAYNEKSSRIFKLTVQMQKYYRKILGQYTNKKNPLQKAKHKGSNDKNKLVPEQNIKNNQMMQQQPKSSEAEVENQESQKNEYDV